jgi:FkbM family methyltransferase
MPLAKNLLKRALARFDIAVTRKQSLDALRAFRSERERDHSDLPLLRALNAEFKESRLLACLAHSQSQLRQDVFVASQLHFKRNGFFVEFGAADRIHLSNTYMLETQFGWNGIVAEPARCWHDALRKQRRCHIETDCVWGRSNETISFDEVAAPELSTASIFRDVDGHRNARKQSCSYSVNTISLNDLLRKYEAPRAFDYLSIDTEGSEYEILSAFDFSAYSPSIITCEHNHTAAREKIYGLLSGEGYERVFCDYSRFDDWYRKIA